MARVRCRTTRPPFAFSFVIGWPSELWSTTFRSTPRSVSLSNRGKYSSALRRSGFLPREMDPCRVTTGPCWLRQASLFLEGMPHRNRRGARWRFRSNGSSAPRQKLLAWMRPVPMPAKAPRSMCLFEPPCWNTPSLSGLARPSGTLAGPGRKGIPFGPTHPAFLVSDSHEDKGSVVPSCFRTNENCGNAVGIPDDCRICQCRLLSRLASAATASARASFPCGDERAYFKEQRRQRSAVRGRSVPTRVVRATHECRVCRDLTSDRLH